MNLHIPQPPPILVGCDINQWRKWFAFWSMPLNSKADLVDQYPELVIEKVVPGATPRVYFNPAVLDTIVPDSDVYKYWDHIRFSDLPYPRQTHPTEWVRVYNIPNESEKKDFLFRCLDNMNFAVLAYKYRYEIRPENYHLLGTDYQQALLDATTLHELYSFYSLTHLTDSSIVRL